MPNVTVTLSLDRQTVSRRQWTGQPNGDDGRSGIATFTNATVSNGGWGYKRRPRPRAQPRPLVIFKVPSATSSMWRGYCNSGSMTTPRRFHTATSCRNGLVLIAGGFGTASAELYNRLRGLSRRQEA